MRPSSFSLVILIISFLLSQPSSSDAAVNCNNIAKSFKPCIDWVATGHKKVAVPPKACCNEMHKLNNMGIDYDAEIAICECVKSEMQDPNIDEKIADKLTWRCGVLLPFPTVPKVNCSEINATNTRGLNQDTN
ncbi:non-specific lipid-transfer protein 1-like [Lycium barbarum]|uniref:non-specific lipid-transfer protein 1-like n=1 Tax=Lycium barbarum TaxID=112863 RepID=UPI00293F6A26|nr:non-specific lipid-transfer protein 1-like [Lycium barbarum]